MSGRIASKLKSKRSVKSLNDSDEKRDDEDADTALLSKSFPTNISSLTKAAKLLDDATDEVRDYLSFECELLYECRVCRNIFRSVSNFISHKRNFCQEKFNCVVHVKCSNNVDDSTNVSETTTLVRNDEKKKDDDARPDKKSLNSLIENLAQKKQFGFERTDFSINKFYKGYKHGISFGDSKNETRLNLDRIDGSDSGVYQTVVKNQDDCDNNIQELQLEVAEIHNLLAGQSVVLGPDGKIMDINKGNTTRTGLLAAESYTISTERTCEECNIKFATRKTYLSHMKHKHADSRLVYPCPDCSEVYASPWSVYRHLFNIHRKTLAQVRKLRDTIQSKAYNQTQPNAKKSPQSSSQDMTEQERIDDENLEWMANFETDNDMQMCGGCGKRFERRAALNSHSQTCQKRIAARNTIVVNKSKRSAGTDEKANNDKKPAKILKIENNEVKNVDKRKSSVILRKRKTGSIQIRYDYIKNNVNDKNSEVKVENDVVTAEINKNGEIAVDNQIKIEEITDFDNNMADNVFENMVISKIEPNTEELYSIIGVTNETKHKNGSNGERSSDVLDAEIFSVNSSNTSNNTTPNKTNSQDIPNLPDETDSEIEEIFNTSDDVVKTEYFNSTTNIDPTKTFENNLLNEATFKLINLISPSEPKHNTLDDKMFDYVDVKKLQCRSCDIRFSNISKLRCHMSMHFNWMRYCCDICSRKAYEKITIYEHIERDHNVIEQDKIEAVIFQLPDWESFELSSKDFIYLNNDTTSNNLCLDMPILSMNVEETSNTPDSCVIIKTEELPKRESGETAQQGKTQKGRGRPPKKNHVKPPKAKRKTDEDDDNKTFEDKKCVEEPLLLEKDSSEMNSMQENDLRKMVFEVIFGQNNESTADSDVSNKSEYEPSKNNSPVDEQPEVTTVSTRPVRNRVKPVNKDFIYDLNDLMDGPRSVSQNSNKSMNSDKHITGSMEDLSGGNKLKYVVKKPAKRPGPKCKTSTCFVDLGNYKSIDLQSNGSNSYGIDVPEEDDRRNSTKKTLRVYENKSKKTSLNKTFDSDSDVCIIEDD